MGRASLVAVLCTATAAAGGNTLPGGATITFGDLYLHEGGNPQLAPAQDPPGSFNLAHCACSQIGAAPPAFVERTFAYELALANATTAIHRPLELWVGAGCDDATARATGCHLVSTIADLSTIGAGVEPELPIFDVMEPAPGATSCEFRAVVSGEWAIADGDGDGVYDYFAGQPVATDALAPPLPTDFRVLAAQGVLDIGWTPPDDTTDIAGYQVLCATRHGGLTASTRVPPPPRYTTARALCGLALDVPLHPAAIDTGSPATAFDASDGVAIPQGIAQLDPAFLCAEQLDPAATHVRIDGLQTRDEDVVMLLAIDSAGNASAVYFNAYLTEHVVGGCCRAGRGGDGGLVSAIAVIAVLTRRRRGRAAQLARAVDQRQQLGTVLVVARGIGGEDADRVE